MEVITPLLLAITSGAFKCNTKNWEGVRIWASKTFDREYMEVTALPVN